MLTSAISTERTDVTVEVIYLTVEAKVSLLQAESIHCEEHTSVSPIGLSFGFQLGKSNTGSGGGQGGHLWRSGDSIEV